MRQIADDSDVEQAVVMDASGVTCMPPAYAGPLPTATSHALNFVDLAVDGQAERARVVDRERAQHGARRRASVPESRCTVFAQRFASGVETRCGDARVPTAVHAAEIDDLVDAVLERRRTRRADAWCRSRARGRSRCPRQSGRSRAGGPVSAATPATSVTSPSPPHATRSLPDFGRAQSRASSARRFGRDVSSHPGARAAFESGSSLRVRPRPAAGLTIAVHGHARRLVRRRAGALPVSVRSVARDELDPARMPKHVAIVMDGNGRWAQQRGLKRTDGPAAGEEALFDTVEGALEIGLPWMTVYAFSTENWRRPLDEVRFLMGFNERLLLRRRDDLNERGVRVRFIGRRGGRVPARVRQQIEETEALTASNRRMTLTFAFNYGGRAEIADAVRDIATRSRPGGSTADKIDERMHRAGTSTRPTCPIPTRSCARRASSGSRTTCCGSSPTPSSCSPTCSGPISGART